MYCVIQVHFISSDDLRLSKRRGVAPARLVRRKAPQTRVNRIFIFSRNVKADNEWIVQNFREFKGA